MCGAQRPRKFIGSQAIAHYVEQSSGGSNCMARLIHSLAIATGIQLPLPLVAQLIWKLLLVREESCAKRLRGVVHEGLLRDDATGEPSAR